MTEERCVEISADHVRLREDLTSTQEETDTRLPLHAFHAAWNGSKAVVISSEDTDVFVPCLAFKSQCRNISRISNQFRKIEFWFIPPKQPFGMVISKNDIKKSPSALQLKNFRKVRKFTKNTIFIHEISLNFERFQRNSTGTKKLLLTSSSSHI